MAKTTTKKAAKRPTRAKATKPKGAKSKGPAPKKTGRQAPQKPKPEAPRKQVPESAPNVPAKAAKRAKKPAKPTVTKEQLDALRKPVVKAKADMDEAKERIDDLHQKAQALLAQAKMEYRDALAPYRDACKQAGVECEFEGGRAGDVSAKVSYIVEKTDKGVRVMVKGRPETDEVIQHADLKKSLTKAAYAYAEKHIGPREQVGNKGGSLSNRLRAAIQA